MQQFELLVDSPHRASGGFTIPRHREAPHRIVHPSAPLGIERAEELLESRQRVDPGQHQVDRDAGSQAGLQLQQATAHGQRGLRRAIGAGAQQPIGIDRKHDPMQGQRGAASTQQLQQGLPCRGPLAGQREFAGGVAGLGLGLGLGLGAGGELRAGGGAVVDGRALDEHCALAQPPGAGGIFGLTAQQTKRGAREQRALAGVLGAQHHVPRQRPLRAPRAQAPDPAGACIQLFPLPMQCAGPHRAADAGCGGACGRLQQPAQCIAELAQRLPGCAMAQQLPGRMDQVCQHEQRDQAAACPRGLQGP